MTKDEIKNKLVGFFNSNVNFKHLLPSNFNSHTDIIEMQIVDSLSLVELIVFIEHEFHIELDPLLFTEDVVRNIENMSEFIHARI